MQDRNNTVLSVFAASAARHTLDSDHIRNHPDRIDDHGQLVLGHNIKSDLQCADPFLGNTARHGFHINLPLGQDTGHIDDQSLPVIAENLDVGIETADPFLRIIPPVCTDQTGCIV